MTHLALNSENSSIKRSGSWIILFFILLVTQAFLNTRLRGLDTAWVPPADETQRKWDPRLFRVFSFGHLPAALDWIMIETLADDALSHLPAGVHPKLYYQYDLLTDLDPAFYAAYMIGASLLAVIRDDGAGARDLLIKAKNFRRTGLLDYPESFRKTYWGRNWELYLLLAYVYLFELKDMPHAAVEFKEAAALPGAPQYLQSLAKRLSAPGGSYEVAHRLIFFTLDQAKTPEAREKLEAQKRSLEVMQYLYQIQSAFEKFRESNPSRAPLLATWERFLTESGTSRTDPWGGTIEAREMPQGSSSGIQIVTTTPYEPVMGLQ